VKRKIIAAAAAVAATAGISIVSAPAANAYSYWRNGYNYSDTSYAGNVSGSYVKTVGRRDVAQQVYYLKIDLYDTVSDSNRAAVKVHGWDKQSGKWTYYYVGTIEGSSGGAGHAQGLISISTKVTDTIVVSDGIYGKTYGNNSVAVFRRYPAGS
jgi:hypothetical protein